MTPVLRTVIGLLAVVLLTPALSAAQTAAVLYERATTREATARKAPSVAALRGAVSAYEQVVLRHPRSGYCDDALWNGAELARFAWERFGQEADRRTADRLYTWLRKEYPASSKVREAATRQAGLTAAAKPAAPASPPAPAAPSEPASSTGPLATLRQVSVQSLPKGDRVVLEFDREVRFSSERIADPDRVFFDLARTDLPAPVQSAGERLAGTRLTTLRFGRQADQTTRVVLELAGAPTHSAFVLYNPYRLVVDVESDTVPAPPVAATGPSAAAATTPEPNEPAAPPPPPPAPASTTTGGDYTLARQLGLGVSRVVIDPGHGGHDPGAQANGLTEAALTLDIALRVEALLKKAGVDVVLTRRTNVFIPLEERTAIANREDADLFLSIHANAARRTAARGVETYFLNFATNPDAEAVAARENATSTKSMGNLPKLIQQITLNDKVKESRELASIVQTTMIRGLRPLNRTVQDLGVKQAPFVVLIGAGMPSVLAEISFITNKSEATLLKRENYKQRIAQSLADSVLKYQASLKKSAGVPTPAK